MSLDRTVAALIISTDGQVRAVDTLPNLAALQKVVGGYLECLTLRESPNVHLYCNEEGKLDGLPGNRLATELAEHYIPGFARHDIICGDVIVLGSTTDGEEADVPQDVEDTAHDIQRLLLAPQCSANVGGDPAGGCDNFALPGSDLCARHAEEAGER